MLDVTKPMIGKLSECPVRFVGELRGGKRLFARASKIDNGREELIDEDMVINVPPEPVVRYVNIPRVNVTHNEGQHDLSRFVGVARNNDVSCPQIHYTLKLTFIDGKLVSSEVIR